MSRTTVVYVSNEDDLRRHDLSGLTKAHIVLSGESVLGAYSDDAVELRTDGFVKAASLKTSGGFPGVLLGTERKLQVYLHQAIGSYVKDKLSKTNHVHILIELLAKLVRYTKWGKQGVVFAVSKGSGGEGASYLIEELCYDNGTIIEFTERSVPPHMLRNNLEKYAKDAIKRFGDRVCEVAVCGPEEESAYAALLSLNGTKLNLQLVRLMRVMRSAITQQQKDKTWLLATFPFISLCIALGMVHVAKDSLKSAQSEYEAIMDSSPLARTKGRGPIELIEHRAAYMREQKSAREVAFKLPVLLNAVANVRNQNPDLEVNIGELIYHSKQLEGAVSEFDYSISLRFKRVPNLDPASELAAWKQIINQFSAAIPGEVLVQDNPTTTVDAQGEAFLMLINGRFQPLAEVVDNTVAPEVM